MRMDKQSQMLNNFHIYGVKSRVLPPERAQSDRQPSYGELLCLTLDDILPTPDDKSIASSTTTLITVCSLLVWFVSTYLFLRSLRIVYQFTLFYRVWKYLLLLYRESGRTKYALEALNLHLQHYGLPPRLAFEIVWSRFVNSKGGQGGNIPCDLHMEHLNRALKTSILGLGANITDSSVTRSAKCLRTVLDVCENFDTANDISPQSTAYSVVSAKKDMETILNELSVKSKVFAEQPGRVHRSFRNCRRNRFGTIDWNKLTVWFDSKKKKFIEIHTIFDEDFMQ